MNRLTNGFVLVGVLLLIGCGSGVTHERGFGTDGRSVGVSKMTTPWPPRETIRRAAAVGERLEIKGSSGGLFGGGGNWAIKADHYSASTSAKTAAGESIHLTARWVSDRRTELTVQSQLVDAQHRHLVEQIRDGMKDAPAPAK